METPKMLTEEATPARIRQWKTVYAEYAPRLKPNRKTGGEMAAYLRKRYPVTELADERLRQIVIQNMLDNEHSARKLPAGRQPAAVVFSVADEGAGRRLYARREAPFAGVPVVVGIELETGFFHAEGSAALWDELFAFRGLDAEDLQNFYLVAEYVACAGQYGLLGDALR